MNIDDVLYFSPHYRFRDLAFDKPAAVVGAFQDRVEGYYLKPAALLIKDKHAFAAGLVICAAIEFIARIWGQKQEPEEWLHGLVPAFQGDRSIAALFWSSYRHGLAHDGRVQYFGQFSFGASAAVTRLDQGLIVNPELLLGEVAAVFAHSCQNVTDDRAQLIAAGIKRRFEQEVLQAKRT